MVSNAVPAALNLANHGLYPVRLHYPIFGDSGVSCSCGNPSCGNSTGKHPVNKAWGKSASTDAEVIEDQFGNAPWNVGIILGICTGIPADQAIIDIENDTDEGGELAEVLVGDVPTPSFSSGKSVHRLFRWSPDLPDVANMTVTGLEFRFGGGGKQTQSVAPPSRHFNGKDYAWLPGRSLDDLPIATLPQHVLEWIQTEWARDVATKSAGPSSTDARKFRSPRGKIGPGARHHSLLIEANALWRIAYERWGINGFEEQEVIDRVWMWLAGGNLLICDPPKTESEVNVIFRSSMQFMHSEILKEIVANEERQAEMTEPASADDDSFGGWLAHHGIRLQPDRSMGSMEESDERIDEWVANWKMDYLTEGDEELIAVHFEGLDKPVTMKHTEFDKADSFARRVQQDTKGKLCLQRTFTRWDWSTIWNGRPNDKKRTKGITRGLREFLLNKAKVVEHKSQSLADQVEDLILSLAGNLSSIEAGLEEWRSSAVEDSFHCRLKDDGGGGLCTLRLPEDPITGWYLIENEIWLMVKRDEIVGKYRSRYGGSVSQRIIVEAMEKTGFEYKRFSRGHLEGRWYRRKSLRMDDNDVDNAGEG